MFKSINRRYFFLIISLLVLISFATSNSFAVDVNETGSVLENNIEINSQEVIKITLSGASFEDIQGAVFAAREGDTIVLDRQSYVGNGNGIIINKSVNIIGKEGMKPVLDARGLSNIFIIQDKGINILIKNCEFMGGKTNYGGAMYIFGNNIEISDCTFKYNEATRGGGAIYTNYEREQYPNAGDNIKLINCIFQENTAYIAAGAIGIYGNHNEIINCKFISNKVYNKNKELSNVYGGAMQIGKNNENIVAKCENCEFRDNSATSTVEGYVSHGGAGCVREGISYINCKFISNTADHGGALTYHSSGNIIGCVFENNVATSLYGGALSIDVSTQHMDLTVKDSVFDGNAAPEGGACYLIGENVMLDNCTFQHNSAKNNGGAIFIKSHSTTVKNSIINNNIANVNGGGIYINADLTTINNNEFNYNGAIPDVNKLNDGLGGAIYVNSSTTFIFNNNLRYNTARNGSAVYIDKTAINTEINDNTMFQNQAWVYKLTVNVSKDTSYYGEIIVINSEIRGGNNIGRFNSLEVSNAIYNNANPNTIIINNENPVDGATNSGELYQDDREYNVDISLKVVHEDGTVVYDDILSSDVYGNVKLQLQNIKPGQYSIYSKHLEDEYYKEITNQTTFTVLPKVDVKITKESNYPTYNYGDVVKWELVIANNGPNKATNIIIKDILPIGLVWLSDNSEGRYNPETGILTLDELDISQTFTLNIFTLINKTGLIVNDADVTSDEYDYDLSNNHDFINVLVNPAADLSINKQVNNTKPNYGDEITWTITIANNGPDDATEVKVNEKLPTGIIWLNDNSEGKYNPKTGIWDVSTLKRGETQTLIIKTLVNKTGKLVNNVDITAKEYDYDLTNNEGVVEIEVSKATDLQVTKMANCTNPNYLDKIKWTIIVKNNGPDDATGVKVHENIDEGFIILNHNGGEQFNGNIWNVGDLLKGEIKELVIYCMVNKTGVLYNKVNITGNEYDYNKTNNDDLKTIIVPPASDISIIKTVDNKNPLYGDIICWTIEIKNNGPDGATTVKVTDIIPNGLTYIRSTLSKGTFNSNSGLWDVGFVAPNSSEFLNIFCRVDKTGHFTNNASVMANEYDFNMSNNNDSESIIVDKTIDLAIEIHVNNSKPDYRQTVQLTLKATNNGPDDATGVKVSNVLPEGLIIINSDFNNGIWFIGNLKSSESKSLNLICFINKTGNFTNFANIKGNELEINLKNNNDSKSIYVRPAVDLSISKTSSKVDYVVGEIIDYFVKISNNGLDTATNVKLTDILDKNMEFIEYSSDLGVFSDEGKIWTIDKLENGQSANLNFKALATHAGDILNKASVICDEYDFDILNNMAELEVSVKNIVANNYNNDIIEKTGISNVYKHAYALEKTGSPLTIIIVVCCMLIPFGFSYLSKRYY